jgi:hypothetical protein
MTRYTVGPDGQREMTPEEEAAFEADIAANVPKPDFSATIANSYSTRLTAKAAKLDKRGDSFGAAKLLIKANEVKNG